MREDKMIPAGNQLFWVMVILLVFISGIWEAILNIWNVCEPLVQEGRKHLHSWSFKMFPDLIPK